MTHKLLALVAAGLLVLGSSTRAADTVMRSALHDYRLVTVAEGLVQPWSVATLPDGDILITERPGRLRLVRKGALLPTPVEGVPAVFQSRQGGLFEVVPHPQFATNRLLYMTYAKPQPDCSATKGTGRTAGSRGATATVIARRSIRASRRHRRRAIRSERSVQDALV